MTKLNLPDYTFNIRSAGNGNEIFDSIRRKFVALTPEEWVRQNFSRFLVDDRKFPRSLMAIEKTIMVNNLRKRGDIVVYDKTGKPIIMVECKSFSVNITQKSFDQAARYNLSLNVKYLILTNGLKHYCCEVNHEKKNYRFLEEIPFYSQISI